MGLKWKAREGEGLFDVDEMGHGLGLVNLRDVYKWYNRDSFFCAWELLKQAQGGRFTAWEFSHALGCSQRTIYRWLNEDTSYPQGFFLRRMAGLFSTIIGEDWMEQVARLQVALGTQKQSTTGGSSEDRGTT